MEIALGGSWSSQGTAVSCFVLAVFLYALPNVLSAIIASGGRFEVYTVSLEVIGSKFQPLMYVCLAIGIIFFVWSEVEEKKKKNV